MVIDSLFQKRSQNYQSTCRQTYPPPKKSTEMQKKAPKLSKNEMLSFGLCSTSDDQPSNLSDESQPKCDKRPPKSSKNEILIFGLHSTSDDQPCNPSNKGD